jgi:hypothetical protein
MNEASIQQPDSANDPNFVRVRRGVITEGNWPEYQAKGFVFLENQQEPSDATHHSRVEFDEKFFGAKNVYTGHAFDLDEGRPLAHKPGLGIYAGPDADEYLVAEWSREQNADQHQSSSEGGPPSS